MSLAKFRATDFRNFENLDLDFNPDMNFIVGNNGSGKTSLLEAIFYLSHGRSFNTGYHNKVVRFDQDNFVLSGDVTRTENGLEQNIKLGLRRYRNSDIDIRIDGQGDKKISALAKVLPVQLITPESFKLFFGGPKERRHFFDFGLFHVKHSFYETWLRFTRIHKHRNALLKKRPQKYNEEFEYWDGEFCRLAVMITQQREEYLSLFNSKFEETNLNIESLLTQAEVKFVLSSGYSLEDDLLKQLKSAFYKDVKYGYTTVGPHKSDVRIKTKQRLVEDVFSRGQLKLLLYVVKLLQSNIISEHNITPIMLIDDIASEVDKSNLASIFEYLQSAQETQFFITSLNRDIAGYLINQSKSHAMFHVKHGMIKQNIGI